MHDEPTCCPIGHGKVSHSGARGASRAACNFRDSLAVLQEYGAQQVLALSSDDAQCEQDLVRRLLLPCSVRSDPELPLAAALDLPTFQANDWTL